MDIMSATDRAAFKPFPRQDISYHAPGNNCPVFTHSPLPNPINPPPPLVAIAPNPFPLPIPAPRPPPPVPVIPILDIAAAFCTTTLLSASSKSSYLNRCCFLIFFHCFSPHH